jgi:prepilin-type processing-associated H-X9-DG protein/prepilin-type N-terminal cleavage/methylation domain-containing protein
MLQNLSPLASLKPRSAFTLTELLVTIGVISVLSALLLSVFSSARKRSQIFTCSSHLKQIGQAIEMYVSDNAGFYPRVYNALNPLDANIACSRWVESIYPYVRKTEVFECPAAPDWMVYETGCPPDMPNLSNRFYPVNFDGAYDLNSPIPENFFERLPNGQWNKGYADKAINQIRYRRPSSTILVIDGDGYFVNPSHKDPPFEGVEGLKECGVDAWHNNGANVCFADGHVKWLSLQSLTKRSLWTLNGSE